LSFSLLFTPHPPQGGAKRRKGFVSPNHSELEEERRIPRIGRGQYSKQMTGIKLILLLF